jgi:hypothetical protein
MSRRFRFPRDHHQHSTPMRRSRFLRDHLNSSMPMRRFRLLRDHFHSTPMRRFRLLRDHFHSTPMSRRSLRFLRASSLNPKPSRCFQRASSLTVRSRHSHRRPCCHSARPRPFRFPRDHQSKWSTKLGLSESAGRRRAPSYSTSQPRHTQPCTPLSRSKQPGAATSNR